MSDLNTDPRNVGTSGLSGLRGISQQENKEKPYSVKAARARHTQSLLDMPAVEDVGYIGAGDSKYDRNIPLSEENFYNLSNWRGTQQSGALKVVNGVLKGVNLAGTTFLQGTVGLVNGIGNAIATKSLSGFWNNDFNLALKDWNDQVEKALPNYYTDKEQERPWYENIFTANFLGDKVIKNLGFTVGAFYSGGIWAKPLSAIGAISKLGWAKAVASGLGATLSAVNEGSIEAVNNSTDWFNLEDAKLRDNLAEELQKVELYKGTTNYEALKQRCYDNYQIARNDLKEQQAKMGNVDFLMNLPILLASNIVEFGKLYARGFSTAQKAGSIGRQAGKYTNEMTKAGARARGAVNALSEGVEEVAQQAASNIAGQLYLPEEGRYNLSMHGAGINPEAEDQVVSFMKGISKGINDTMNDGSTWEQFFIGALTGFLGMPTFGRANNANAYLGKDKLIGLSGGYFGEKAEYNQQREETDKIVEALNQRVQDPKFLAYYQGLIRHAKFQNDMDAAAEEGKAKEFKDAEYAQMISDISLFAKAGKLDDYTDMLNEAVDTSDENLASIIRNTTKEDGTGPFIDATGNPMTATEEGKKQMIKGLQDRKAEMLNAVNQYRKLNESLASEFGDNLTDSEREELVWLNMLSKNQSNRAAEIAGKSRGLIQSLIDRYQADLLDLRTKDPADITEEEYKNQNIIQKNIDVLTDLLSRKDADIAYNIAKQPNLLLSLLQANADRLTDSNIQEVRDSIKDLTDIPTLVKDSERYAKKLKEYLEDPSKLAKQQEKERKAATTRTQRRKSSKIVDNLNAATNFDEVRSALSNNQEDRDINEDAINNSTNALVQEYKDLRNKVNSIRRDLGNQINDTNVIADANEMLDNFMTTAQSGATIDLSSEIFSDPANLSDKEGETSEAKAERQRKAKEVIERSLTKTNSSTTTNTNSVPPGATSTPTPPTPSSGSSQVGTAPAANTPPSPTTTTAGGIITLEHPDGTSGLTVDTKTFKAPTTGTVDGVGATKAEQLDEEAPKSTGQETTWRPAVAKYDLTSMQSGGRELNSNAEWLAVHDYIAKAGGFEFVDSGELAKYAKAGKAIYFGIDPNFSGNWANTVFIYVQKEDGTYIPIGSLFVSKSSTDKFVGQTEFIQYVKDQFAKLSDEDKTKLFITDKTSKIADVTRGRVAFSNTARPVSDALQGGEVTTPNIVVITYEGVEGKSDDTVITPDHYTSKAGRAYVEVPNAKRGYKGGKSLVYVEPVAVSDEVFAQNNFIVNQINAALEQLITAATQQNTAELGRALSALADNLLIQNYEIAHSKDWSTLYVNKVVTNSNGEIIKVKKGDKFYAKTAVVGTIKLTDAANALDTLKGTLIKEGIKVRINADRLSPAYTQQLIDNGLVVTYATQLKVEAAWYKVKPVSLEEAAAPVGQQPAAAPQAAPQQSGQQPPKKLGLMQKARPKGPVQQAERPEGNPKPPAQIAAEPKVVGQNPPSQPAQRPKNQRHVAMLVNGGFFTQEEVDKMTADEVERAIACI